MALERRGVQGIRTMAALVDQRRTRSAAGALIELSALANEKLLLEREVSRAARRGIEIQRRLKEISAKEERLMKIAQGQAQPPEPVSKGRTIPIAPTDTTTATPTSSRFKISEFTY